MDLKNWVTAALDAAAEQALGEETSPGPDAQTS
jgi:hypothetical protein